jgi:hypothetical protein
VRRCVFSFNDSLRRVAHDDARLLQQLSFNCLSLSKYELPALRRRKKFQTKWFAVGLKSF